MKKLFVMLICVTMLLSITACGEKPEELYSSIKEELKTTESLENNYFAEYYDMNGISAAKEAAIKATESSDEDSYKEVLDTLHKENEAFKSFIKEEEGNVFNAVTNVEGLEPYPFAIENIDENASFDPMYKVSSKEPEYISTEEAETTDGEPSAHIWIDSSSYPYLYKIEQIDTIDVQVKNDAGETEKALVNTKINFKATEDYDDMKELNERDMYLIKLKDDRTAILVPSYSGDDYYIPYIRS